MSIDGARLPFVVLIAALLALPVPVSAQAADADGFRPLFDGETLDGWAQVGPGRFIVEGGEAFEFAEVADVAAEFVLRGGGVEFGEDEAVFGGAGAVDHGGVFAEFGAEFVEEGFPEGGGGRGDEAGPVVDFALVEFGAVGAGAEGEVECVVGVFFLVEVVEEFVDPDEALGAEFFFGVGCVFVAEAGEEGLADAAAWLASR